jgi:hypothetical protein
MALAWADGGHCVGELCRGENGFLGSLFDQGAGDPPGLWLFAIVDQDALQFLHRAVIDDVRCAQDGIGIHPQVERTVVHEGETFLWIIQLL